MLKNIVVLLFLTAMSLAQNHQESKQTDRESYELKGPVKSAAWYSAPLNDSNESYTKGCCSLTFEINFGQDGMVTKSGFRGPISDGGPIGPQILPKRSFTNGRLTEEVNYNSDGSVKSRTTYDYDARGNMVVSLIYSSNGSLFRRTVFEYDADGHLTHTTSYYGDGTPNAREMYSGFDANGNWAKLVRWSWSKDDGQYDWRKYMITYRVIHYFETESR